MCYNIRVNRLRHQGVGFPTLCYCKFMCFVWFYILVHNLKLNALTNINEKNESRWLMKKKRVVDVVADIVAPFAKTQGMELVDVEFVKEGPYRYLRVTIDKEEGVSLDDCQLVSQHLNSKLDTIDPIEEQYFLEVTSPGVERQLKKDQDFERFKGREVQLKLYQPFEGQKVINGILLGLVDDNIMIKNEAMGEVQIPKSKVSVAKLIVDFE